MGAEAGSCLNKILKKEGEPTAAAAPPSTRSTTTTATKTRNGAMPTPTKRKKVRISLTDTCLLIVNPPGLPDDDPDLSGRQGGEMLDTHHLTSPVGWGYRLRLNEVSLPQEHKKKNQDTGGVVMREDSLTQRARNLHAPQVA